ncbi:hypothetical protein ACJ73_02609 [Blastomyces percursus]|uniref:RING-type domain-containing protein n=1 Tax=Blastomyces percursus TaxID=1658174 RepID=A0A1J9QD41_9EURO|nr:hypothetical protein ACJ73_02609 [Blastomyces percursus]
MNTSEISILPCDGSPCPLPDTYVVRKIAGAGDDERCYICFEGWKIGDDMVRLRCCNHWLHEDCLSQSVLDGRCPTCRISLSSLNDEVVLRDAAAVGDVEKVKQFLEKHICQSTWDFYGRTPLHLAALHGHEAVVKVLLDNGSDLSVVDFKQQTPLHIAACRFPSSIVVILVERGAVLGAQDREGMTPLHLAYQNGIERTIDYLLEKGADPDARNDDGSPTASTLMPIPHRKPTLRMKDNNNHGDASDTAGQSRSSPLPGPPAGQSLMIIDNSVWQTLMQLEKSSKNTNGESRSKQSRMCPQHSIYTDHEPRTSVARPSAPSILFTRTTNNERLSPAPILPAFLFTRTTKREPPWPAPMPPAFRLYGPRTTNLCGPPQCPQHSIYTDHELRASVACPNPPSVLSARTMNHEPLWPAPVPPAFYSRVPRTMNVCRLPQSPQHSIYTDHELRASVACPNPPSVLSARTMNHEPLWPFVVRPNAPSIPSIWTTNYAGSWPSLIFSTYALQSWLSPV